MRIHQYVKSTYSHEHTTKDCTDVSCGVVSSLQKLQLVIEKVNVLTLVQFIMGSSTMALKALSLDSHPMLGAMKLNFPGRNGRKQLEKLIYHLIIIGKIKQIPAGTIDRPSKNIIVGDVNALLAGHEEVWC